MVVSFRTMSEDTNETFMSKLNSRHAKEGKKRRVRNGTKARKARLQQFFITITKI